LAVPTRTTRPSWTSGTRPSPTSAAFPDEPVAVETRRHYDETRQKQYLFQRLIGELDGTPVAAAYYGEAEWSHYPGKYMIGVEVIPEYRRLGWGTAVYDHIWGALTGRDPKPTVLTTYAREDDPDSMRFAEKRGFRVAQRNQFSADGPDDVCAGGRP
jgi:ribosomal protein S18 acetylase RimI-like enzyme